MSSENFIGRLSRMISEDPDLTSKGKLIFEMDELSKAERELDPNLSQPQSGKLKVDEVWNKFLDLVPFEPSEVNAGRPSEMSYVDYLERSQNRFESYEQSIDGAKKQMLAWLSSHNVSDPREVVELLDDLWRSEEYRYSKFNYYYNWANHAAKHFGFDQEENLSPDEASQTALRYYETKNRSQNYLNDIKNILSF